MTASRLRAALRLPAIVLLVAACGAPTPSVTPPDATPGAPSTAPSATPAAGTPAPTASGTPTAGDPNAAIYAAVEAQVIKLRGLQPTAPVRRSVLDEAGLHDFVVRSFADENPAALVEATQALYRELLLLPRDASLEDLYVELYSTSVAGLYDNTTKQLYVLSESGTIGPLERTIYAHEYTHALQDQRFDLQTVVGDAKDQSDRTLARTTYVEGDAYLTMGLWAKDSLTAAELGEVAAGADPASEAAIAKLPEIVRQALLFPATSGFGLALADYARGGFAAVDERFHAPPDSTEQVLHPDKLAAGEAPVAVTFPSDLAARLGAGWTVTLQDTMGEMQLEILLRTAGATTSREASAGWGGDRVALLEGPDGAVGVVLDTSWDTEADAGAFAGALEPLVAKLAQAGRRAAVLMPEPDRVVLVTGSSDAVLGLVANVLGLAG